MCLCGSGVTYSGSSSSCLRSCWINTLHFRSAIYVSVIKILYTVVLLLIYSVHSTSVPPLLLFLIVSSIFLSLLKSFFGEFFLIRIRGSKDRGCADCKAPWGKLWFVTLGYINKNRLHYFLESRCHDHGGCQATRGHSRMSLFPAKKYTPVNKWALKVLVGWIWLLLNRGRLAVSPCFQPLC